MKKYYKIICSNGYCDCDEEFFEYCEPDEIGTIAEEILYSEYAFYEPDSRFVDWDDEDELEEYYNGLGYDIIEMTKEEYENHD